MNRTKQRQEDERPFWETEFGVIFWRTWLIVASLLLLALMIGLPVAAVVAAFRSASQ